MCQRQERRSPELFANGELPPFCCIGSIGKVGYLTQEGITNQQINSAIPSEAVNSLFLYYTCASPSFYNELQLLSSAVTISIINKSKMENIKVSLPPLLEQKCIVKKNRGIIYSSWYYRAIFASIAISDHACKAITNSPLYPRFSVVSLAVLRR